MITQRAISSSFAVGSIACALALVACGGGQPTPATSSTSAASTSSALDGKSYEVTLDYPGQKPEKDTIVFQDGKFESTACTGFGFPRWTAYASHPGEGGSSFSTTTKHPDGTTMQWDGTAKGDQVEGTAVRTMNGKTENAHFQGALKH